MRETRLLLDAEGDALLDDRLRSARSAALLGVLRLAQPLLALHADLDEGYARRPSVWVVHESLELTIS